MQWIFGRIMERLVVKLIAMMGLEWDARVEMHLCDTRAELLRKAKKLEAEETLGLDEVVASLRAQAETLGKTGECPASDVLAVAMNLKDENLREPETIKLPEESLREDGVNGRGQLLAPEKKKRGRPKKGPLTEEQPTKE